MEIVAMLQNVKNYLSKWWVYIAGAFTILLALFFYEKKGKQAAEAKLQNAEFEKTDAVIANQQANNEQKLKEEQEALHNIPKPSVDNLNPNQVEDFWKNKK